MRPHACFSAVLALTLLLTAACAPSLVPHPRAGGDRLVLSTTSGLSVIDPAQRRVLFQASAGVPAADWSRLFAVPTAESSSLAVLDLGTGAQQRSLPLPSGFAPAVVSTSGQRIALTEPATEADNALHAPVRNQTRIAILNTNEAQSAPRVLQLDGNFEPEAFSADDRALFVLEYVPPDAPQHYRVRQLDLATGQVSPLLLADKSGKLVPNESEETMRGIGRQHVLAPDGATLYTLYTHQADHLHTRDLARGETFARGNVHAFIHVLSLTERRAYCIDLPEPFGIGAASAHALAIAPDGKHLYVVDRTSGTLATVDPQGMVLSTVRGTPDPQAQRGLASAQVSRDGRTLYVAGGSEVLAIDAARLSTRERWPVAATMLGLGVGADGQRLYLALERQVVVLDAASGERLDAIDAPGTRSLRFAG